MLDAVQVDLVTCIVTALAVRVIQQLVDSTVSCPCAVLFTVRYLVVDGCMVIGGLHYYTDGSSRQLVGMAVCLGLGIDSYVPESITIGTAQAPYPSQRSVDTMCC